MAAFLRRSSRVCRQIVLHATRNHHSSLRQIQSPTTLFTERSIFPRLTSVRPFSDVLPGNEIEPEMQASSEIDDDRLPLDNRRIMSKVQYERLIKKLGGLKAKGTLFQLFDSILAIGK